MMLATALSYAQAPVAAFSASVTEGCASLAVAFRDESGGAPKFWNWDFGNGQLSNLQNPVVVYAAPGVYTVKLVVRNSNGINSITKTDYIRVFPAPTVSFRANLQTACAPATINFTDQSNMPNGSIVSWLWDFGDGTTSTLQNPSKTYTKNGFYTVSLKVVSNTGCTNAAASPRFIRIVNGVTANFSEVNSGNCNPPFTVNFTNQSTGPGTLSYAWDFGNGNQSAQTNPSTNYNLAGNYTVSMIATSSLGCKDTVQKTVALRTASVSANIPDSACLNRPLLLQNTSSPNPTGSNWNFGDGRTSNQNNPLIAYSTPGTYTVKLVSNFGFCRDSISKPIKIVTAPTVDFSADKQASCRAPFSVNFSDQSPNSVSWRWDFGDGSTSTQKNPTHTYLAEGSYTVKLTITSAFGCENTLERRNYIVIEKPRIQWNGVPTAGCSPFTYTPSVSIQSVDGIAAYLWDFGVPGGTSTASNPSFTYNSVGIYTVSLRITTNSGCVETLTIPNAVNVGLPGSADFSAAPTDVCPSTPIQFTDLSVGATQWLWNFGDGQTSNLQNPSHLFQDTGKLTVTLTILRNGCSTTVSKPLLVNIQPPVARFRQQVDCVNRLAAQFVNESLIDPSKLPITYFWEFGDPLNTTSVLQNPSFVYPALGNYTVKLTVVNGPCTHTLTKVVKLGVEQADFTATKTQLCTKERVRISAIGSDSTNIDTYQWRINGGPFFTTKRSFDTSFQNPGLYTLTLLLTDKNGCTETKTVNAFIRVDGVTAKFGTSVGACTNNGVVFTDSSTTSSTALVSWQFNFGDGNIRTFTTPPFTHQYADTGRYNVSLVAIDDKGCRDTFKLNTPIRITKPIANFTSEFRLFCKGGGLQFLDSSIAVNATYFWTFGDGGTAVGKNPIHVYNSPDGFYSVSLKVVDESGCTDSIFKSNFIEIRSPKPDFDLIDSSAICPPLETKFVFKGRDYESFFWDFGDGSISTIQNPNYFYNDYGSFEPKLFLVGYGGCIDSAVKRVNVYNPFTTQISFSPTEACNELLVNFSVTRPPNTRFIFYFGDGSVDSSGASNFSHFYNFPNLYSPYLVLIDSADCRVAVGAPGNIFIRGVEPFFGMDKKRFCDSGTVFFTNYSIGNDTVRTLIWDFGDGVTATTTDAIHTYSSPGTYFPSLTVTTNSGCVRTLFDTVFVYQTPKPGIVGPGEACVLSPVDFASQLQVADTAAIQYVWDFGNGQTDSTANPLPFRYRAPGLYDVTLSAVHPFGCKDSTVRTVIEIHALPTITMPAEVLSVLGQGVSIPVTYSPGVNQYTWTPATGLSCTNCPVPLANPTFNTQYQVSVTDSNNCQSSRPIQVKVICNQTNYFIPNTFSPNNDGSNDVFFPRGSQLNNVQSMRVFNRWGQMIFERKNFPANQPSFGWDGRVDGKPVDVDTYLFIVEVICENGQVIPIKGNVTLIR